MGSREGAGKRDNSRFNVQLSPCLICVDKILSYLEILLVLMMGILKIFWKMDRVEEFQLKAVRPSTRTTQGQILEFFLVEPNQLGTGGFEQG